MNTIFLTFLFIFLSVVFSLIALIVSSVNYQNTASGNFVFDHNLIPTEDNAYSIGNPDYRVKELFLGSGTVFIGATGEIGNDANGLIYTQQGFASPSIVIGGALPPFAPQVSQGIKVTYNSVTNLIEYQKLNNVGSATGQQYEIQTASAGSNLFLTLASNTSFSQYTGSGPDYAGSVTYKLAKSWVETLNVTSYSYFGYEPYYVIKNGFAYALSYASGNGQNFDYNGNINGYLIFNLGGNISNSISIFNYSFINGDSIGGSLSFNFNQSLGFTNIGPVSAFPNFYSGNHPSSVSLQLQWNAYTLSNPEDVLSTQIGNAPVNFMYF